MENDLAANFPVVVAVARFVVAIGVNLSARFYLQLTVAAGYK
jgi:hypothetical protein